jgi:hypothetical protein
MSDQREWRIEKFGTSFAIFEGVRRVAYFYGASEEWTETEAKSNAERALAANASTPTVCPAGPVVEGELRRAILEEAASYVEHYLDNGGTVFSLSNIADGLRARAALTNDPPPAKDGSSG